MRRSAQSREVGPFVHNWFRKKHHGRRGRILRDLLLEGLLRPDILSRIPDALSWWRKVWMFVHTLKDQPDQRHALPHPDGRAGAISFGLV